MRKKKLEEYLNELEEVLESLQSDELLFEDAMGLYKRGLEIINICEKIINTCESKIYLLGENLSLKKFQE